MSRIEELEKRLATDPNSRIFVQLAEEYRKEGLLDNAIEICEAGLAKHPQYPSARVALGRALLQAESFDRAREEFEVVIEQVPDNILANKFLGETYHKLGRLEDAVQKYEIAQTFAPDDADLGTRIEAVKLEMTGPEAAPAPAPVPDDEGADETVVGDPSFANIPVPSQPDELPEESAGSAPDPASFSETPVEAATDAWTTAPEDLTSAEDLAASAVEDIGALVDSETAQEAEVEASSADAFAPIPLVEVDEPMVLEDRAYTPDVVEPPPEPIAPAVAEPEPEAPAVAEPEPTPTPEVTVEPIPVVEPPEDPPVEIAESSELAPPSEPSDMETPTMAELYAEQGHWDKAIVVYRNLLARDPGAAQYLERITELEMLSQASVAPEPPPVAPSGPQDVVSPAAPKLSSGTKVEALEHWLEAIRRSRRT